MCFLVVARSGPSMLVGKCLAYTQAFQKGKWEG